VKPVNRALGCEGWCRGLDYYVKDWGPWQTISAKGSRAWLDVEPCEGSERFSSDSDDLRRALAVLGLSGSPDEAERQCLLHQVVPLCTQTSFMQWVNFVAVEPAWNGHFTKSIKNTPIK
jgi:hypothetical protein